MTNLSVIDCFCGAGGFSEGFRQQGYKIVLGIDNYLPAIETFNHNFNLNCSVKNILDFEDSIDEIEALPDTDVIIGSPPCVSFSHSNNSGKADKEIGIRLTKVFLRVIAVKRYKNKSKLKAWFMENVINSKKHLEKSYTFIDLNLSDWAVENNFDPNQIAVQLEGNQSIINSADYGSGQKRKRLFSGEIFSIDSLFVPPPTHKDPKSEGHQKHHITLGELKNQLPKPNSPISQTIINDPLYPSISIKTEELTDHFYDTGLYSCEYKQSRFLKINHPYMGKMSFPEDETKPSRTVTATKIGASREALIFKSEHNRKGNGEFRGPTVREIATLMGFPFTYQFKGSEGTKWKLIGNAVCPSVSRAFAKQLRIEQGLQPIHPPIVNTELNLEGIEDLNTFSKKIFNNQPKRNKNSRFRRHPFKDGNLTVSLSNYDIEKNSRDISRWITSVQYGNGDGFPTFNFPDGTYREIEEVISKIKNGNKFIRIINNGFTEKIAKKDFLQEMYETQISTAPFLEPTQLIEELARIIEDLDVGDIYFFQEGNIIFKKKAKVPAKQLFALYALNKITSIANN